MIPRCNGIALNTQQREDIDEFYETLGDNKTKREFLARATLYLNPLFDCAKYSRGRSYFFFIFSEVMISEELSHAHLNPDET